MELEHAELQEMIANDPYMLLVDVREPEEFDAGHIPGAGNMTADDICDCLYDEALAEAGLDALANAKGMELSDDASTIVLYSNAGERSARACAHMESIGYVNVCSAAGFTSWPFEVVNTAEEAAVAAALMQNDIVAKQNQGDDDACGCGHDHGNGHEHAHHANGCNCGC